MKAAGAIPVGQADCDAGPVRHTAVVLASAARPSRPVLRYHGAKYRLAPWVCAHLPPHALYVEPFCGSAAILMAKPRSAGEIINDLDEDVVTVFRVLRDRSLADELERMLRLTPYAHAEFRLAYEPAPASDLVEQARRTIVRSFMGHGSGCVTRASRHGFRRGRLTNRSQVPAAEWATYPDAVDAFVGRLQGVVIESRDALDVIAMYDHRDALHYVDPPYLASTRRPGQRYLHEMTDADHRRLSEVLHACRGMVVLSGYPSPLYAELYPGWRRVVRPARDAAANGRTEALWLNEAVDRALGGRLL